MTPQETIWAFTVGLTLLAGWVDFRTHKIPNWLTVSAFILGVGMRSVLGGSLPIYPYRTKYLALSRLY